MWLTAISASNGRDDNEQPKTNSTRHHDTRATESDLHVAPGAVSGRNGRSAACSQERDTAVPAGIEGRAMTLKFYYNGIKDNGGKLQKCSYSDGQLIHYPAGTITIYKRDYGPFSAGVQDAFKVDNDSDMQTDYFEKDRIRVMPEHPLYQQVKTAMELRR